jgi:hypothetical protein
MLVSRVSFKKGRSEKRCGCRLFVSFPPQNTKWMMEKQEEQTAQEKKD